MAVRKIMIVDDSRVELMNLQNIVAKSGCEIITASSGKEAVAKARSEKPDLIFMDVIMDEMDGFSACREISDNAETKHIPVVFVTSKSQKADAIWAQKQGGRGLIGKPYTEEQILDKIKAFA